MLIGIIITKSLEKFEQNLLRDFTSSSFQPCKACETKFFFQAMQDWIKYLIIIIIVH